MIVDCLNYEKLLTSMNLKELGVETHNCITKWKEHLHEDTNTTKDIIE